VSVRRLAREVRASDMTVRRDLARLCDQGLVRKLHGGAVLAAGKAEETHFSATRQEHVEEKRAIAKEAAALVASRSVVALGRVRPRGISPGRSPNVRTSASSRIPPTSPWRSIAGSRTSILTGGHFRTPADALVGPPAVWILERLQSDILFLGANGIDLKAGYTTPILEEVEVNAALIRKTSRVVIVADHSKFGRVDAGHICPDRGGPTRGDQWRRAAEHSRRDQATRRAGAGGRKARAWREKEGLDLNRRLRRWRRCFRGEHFW